MVKPIPDKSSQIYQISVLVEQSFIFGLFLGAFLLLILVPAHGAYELSLPFLFQVSDVADDLF